MKADIELVEELKNGQVKAYSQLVERHQKALLRLCVRFLKDLELAEDVVQEAFVKAYQKIHLFEGRSSFKNWLFQIAANTAKNRLRKMKVTSIGIEHVEIMVPAKAHTGMEGRDLKGLVRSYVDQLPEKQRTALVLRIFEDLSFNEIAKIMGCPYDTAKANYRHAILKLKVEFNKNETLNTWDFQDEEVSVKNIFSEVDR